MNEIDDPADAARTLVKASAALWAEKNDYCDDITAIVIVISGNGDEVDSLVGDEVDSEASVERPVGFYRGSKQKKSRTFQLRSMLRGLMKRKGKKVKETDGGEISTLTFPSDE